MITKIESKISIRFIDCEDLESLKTIQIGDRVFMGLDDQWCQVDLISLCLSGCSIT